MKAELAAKKRKKHKKEDECFKRESPLRLMCFFAAISLF
jgi:hypothetical protein